MGETAWLPSDQPYEAAPPGWVWWFDAPISRFKEKHAGLFKPESAA